MSKQLTGTLKDGIDDGVVATLHFIAQSNNSDNGLTAGTRVTEVLGALGAYDITLLDGVYRVELRVTEDDGQERTLWNATLTVTSAINANLLAALGAQGSPLIVGSSTATLVPETVAGTTYTLDQGDSGKVLVFTNASAVTVTLPNDITAGFNCLLVQEGAGAVSFVAASGATMRNRQSHDGIAGQYGEASLVVTANADGASAIYYLGGDTV